MTGMVRNYVIPAFVLLGILVAWDFTKPRIPASFLSEPFVPSSFFDHASPPPNGGVPPWNENEPIFQNSRNLIRKSTMAGLDKAWSSFCSPDGRKALAASLTHYFWQRGNEEQSYVKRWGDAGRDYIKKEWATPDDRRIERLIEETYTRGYLDLHDLKPYVVERMAPLLKDSHVISQPCKT